MLYAETRSLYRCERPEWSMVERKQGLSVWTLPGWELMTLLWGWYLSTLTSPLPSLTHQPIRMYVMALKWEAITVCPTLQTHFQSVTPLYCHSLHVHLHSTEIIHMMYYLIDLVCVCQVKQKHVCYLSLTIIVIFFACSAKGDVALSTKIVL